MQVRHYFILNILINYFRFSHKNIDKDVMQKFIHDNEQYVLEAKRKHGKTRIDRELNEYLRKKKNNINLYNNNGNNNSNMNNNLNLQVMNNPLLINYLLLQNQLLLQQTNPNLPNQINSLIQQNRDEVNNDNGNPENEDECGKGEKNMDYTHLNRDGVVQKNEENLLEKNDENNEPQNVNEENDFNTNENNNEIIKKILEAINEKNNNVEQRQTDPRKKGK